MDLGSVESVTPDTLVSLLSRQEGGAESGGAGPTLLVDCRPFMAYNAGHIVEAVNVHCPPILKRRSGGFVALENIVVDEERRGRLQRGEYARIVVYDQSTHHLPSADDRDSNLYSVLKSLALQYVPLHKVFYLLGGYDAFSQECPLLCVTQQFSPLSTYRLEPPQSQEAENVPDTNNSDADDDHPVAILPHLLLGCGQHASQLAMLQRLGVTAVVNVSVSCPNHFPSAFNYLHLPVRDSASEDLASWFPAANHFIDEVRAQGGRVLVHCQAGRSRSATVCLAYLIRTLDLSLDAAFEHVRSRRHVIDPNLNFMRQLQSYRQRLDAERGPPHYSDAAAGGGDDRVDSPMNGDEEGEASSSSLPAARLSLSSSSSASQSSDSFRGLSRGTSSSWPAAFTFSGPVLLSGSSPVPSLQLSSSSFPGLCALPSVPLTHAEAAAPITLPSASRESSLPPAYSAAGLSLPSPATANDVHCFFDFSNTEFSFPASSMARTPEITLPS